MRTGKCGQEKAMFNQEQPHQEAIQNSSAIAALVREELRKVIVGQDAMIERMLIALLTGGHILLEGVPGLAKTLAVKTLCQAIDAHFKRIQFTPDLLPADLIGTVIYNQHKGEFYAKHGPIFTNLLLADEINRAPAKVQSALLEAMQEEQVTLGDTTYRLDRPFMVMATQNPIEQEGTYPLPEAQLDRFMMHVRVSYPNAEEERTIMERGAQRVLNHESTALEQATLRPVVSKSHILALRAHVGQVYIDEKVVKYIIDLVMASRHPEKFGLQELKHWIEHGISPRGSIALNVAAKAHAFLHQRAYVTPEDVKAIGYDVLRHRIVRSFEAEASEVSNDQIVRRIFDSVEVP